MNEKALDRELDAYLMKNPDEEQRNSTINANLDKELDDYWSHQENEAAPKENDNSQQEQDQDAEK